MTRLLILLAAFWLSLPAASHRASDADLQLQVQEGGYSAVLQVSLVDLDLALRLDDNLDQQLTWGELRRARAKIQGYLQDRLLGFRGGKPCELRLTELKLSDRLGEPHAWLELLGNCGAARGPLRLDYQLLFDLDSDHRGLVSINDQGEQSSAVLSPRASVISQSGDHGSGDGWTTARSFFASGVHHIWIGADHLAFILILMLPCVLWRRDGQWQAADSARGALARAAWIVTAFTLAHSLTLAAATLGWVSLPIKAVEIAIAASVLLAALNNIWPVVQRRHARLAFAFGLLHGFGFAAVLGASNLDGAAAVLPLFSFNLGVEAGQLVVLAVCLPLLLLLRGWRHYPGLVHRTLSLAVAAVSIWWIWERI